MSRSQRWISATGILLIILEAVSILVLVPLTTFSITLDQVYDVVSLSAALAFTAIGALISIAVVVLVALGLGSGVDRWSQVNAVLLSIGLIASVFMFVDLAVAFGYRGLDDVYPQGFLVAADWAFLMNAAAPPFVLVALMSMAVHYRFRAWKPVTAE